MLSQLNLGNFSQYTFETQNKSNFRYMASDKLVKTILILFQCVQYQIIDFSSKRISNYQYTGIAKKMLTKKK